MAIVFLTGMWGAFLHIVRAPFKDLSVLWQLAPLFLMWVVLEIYFGRWREDLGWNSALANAITLFWIVVSMLQVIFSKEGMFSWLKMIVMVVALLYSLFLCVVVFKHGFKDKVVFFIASPPLIYYTGFVVIVWGHGYLEFSWMVLFVIFLLYWVVFGVDRLVKRLIPDSDHPDNRKDAMDDFGSSAAKDPFKDTDRGFEAGKETGFSSPASGISSTAYPSYSPSATAPPSRPLQSSAPASAPRRRRSSPFR